MFAGVHRSDAAWIQHGQAALRRAAGLYYSPCLFRLILKTNRKTAEMGMVLLGFAHVHVDAHILFVWCCHMTQGGLTVGNLSHMLSQLRIPQACLENAKSTSQ